ncbi:gluconate 2-dehydrogenase subunit 3 family protein [Flavobacterium sp.]|uniref:gluconate 2-dehydrogenase subunit 3 family protein n=1 Tax=Flavobacterium sp. TaxID=239 RepID=UPI0037534A2E
MNRRELIKNIAIISGGLFIGSNFLLTSCKRDDAGSMVLSEDLLKLLSEISETIIPETETVGAKATNVAQFISKVFQDIYSEEEQSQFIAALTMINDKSKELMGDDFVKLSSDKRAELINKVKNPKDKGFLAMYQIILFSYLSSEKGLQASFRYTPVPGKFIGDVPYKKGDKMYAGLNF